MSRLHCISNRNIKIVSAYVDSKLATHQSFFDNLPYPSDEYPSPEQFFLNEDEWTTHDNFAQIFSRAKELVRAKELIDDPDFFFRCGASSARLRSWGRLHYFARIFSSPNDGFRRLPFFNQTFDDVKEIELILPPTYDRNLKKMRALLKIEYHSDFDPNRDYFGDLFMRGIISAIPTIWGVGPAVTRQPLTAYDPVVLLNEAPEFAPFGLEVRLEENLLTLRDPAQGHRIVVGEKILLEPEEINNKMVFLGKYSKNIPVSDFNLHDKRGSIRITKTVRVDGQILLRQGKIFMAPYFILDVSYNPISNFRRLTQIFKIKNTSQDLEDELVDTINQLRKSMRAKSDAYLSLERTHHELERAKIELDENNRGLSHKVEERTAELRKTQQDLRRLNRDLESKVQSQVAQLAKYNELRRYVSPQLTEKILAGEHDFETGPQKKLITVVFTDIRGFSSVADSLESEELFQLLDSYLTEMIKVVHTHDGTLNKIVGDGLLIFFGDPIPMEDHAERAVRMAIQMQQKAAELKEEWLMYGPELGVGIGINTGFITIGSVGPDTHRDYTVIGNQVNVASRLESEARAGQILISQRTFSRVKEIFEVEEMGEIKVKGIHDSIETYNVMWS